MCLPIALNLHSQHRVDERLAESPAPPAQQGRGKEAMVQVARSVAGCLVRRSFLYPYWSRNNDLCWKIFLMNLFYEEIGQSKQ